MWICSSIQLTLAFTGMNSHLLLGFLVFCQQISSKKRTQKFLLCYVRLFFLDYFTYQLRSFLGRIIKNIWCLSSLLDIFELTLFYNGHSFHYLIVRSDLKKVGSFLLWQKYLSLLFLIYKIEKHLLCYSLRNWKLDLISVKNEPLIWRFLSCLDINLRKNFVFFWFCLDSPPV